MNETENKETKVDNDTIKIVTEEMQRQLQEQKEMYEKKLKEQEAELTKKHNEQIRAILSGRSNAGNTNETQEQTEEDEEETFVKNTIDKITENIKRRFK